MARWLAYRGARSAGEAARRCTGPAALVKRGPLILA